MNRKMMLTATFAMVFGLAATAQAQKCEPMDIGAEMVATPEGETLGAGGGVKGVVHDTCSEALGILVVAKLPDGTKLVVEATTPKGTFKAATITMFQGIGELYLESEKDVTDLFPIANIFKLAIRYPQGRSLTAPAPILLEAYLGPTP